ncbi:FAD/NAD(P)-binding domain-containing protein [Nemania sp. NC0429]|nr:FAD/NAD(P)-binding domain-containing protein [Nemania sp. NC0429]
MPPLKILIVGAGVCGPALAALLRRVEDEVEDEGSAAYDITVIERAPGLRETGLQIDIRAQGIAIARKMRVLEAIRSRAVPESGVAFVDERGRAFATFGRNDSGHGAQNLTSEYEIIRGDLVDVLYRASLGIPLDKDERLDGNGNGKGEEGGKTATRMPQTTSSANVRYLFDTTIASLAQDSDSVAVTFSDGREARYDLVVAADGQSSRTRRAVLSAAENAAAFRSLGLFSALYLVPRGPGDDSWMNWHVLPGRRVVITRSANSSKARTQVYMNIVAKGTTSASQGDDDTHGVSAAVASGSTAAQREAFARAFADQLQQQHGVGGRVGRLVEAMPAPEDVYVTEIGQVRCERLVVGRVVLLGDAGYCPSPISGMGTTLGLTGAYVLAGELARRRKGKGKGDIEGALRAYEKGVRPFVKRAQMLLPGTPGALYAESRWGVWLVTTVIWLVAKSRILDLLLRVWPEDAGGLRLPEYPELKLED